MILSSAADLSDPNFSVKYISQMSYLNKATLSYTPSGEILQWDHEAEKLLGIAVEEAKKRNIKSFIPAEKLQEELSKKLETLNAGNIYYQENSKRIHQKGEILRVAIISHPVKENGQLVSILENIILTEDINKIKDLYILSLEYSPVGKILADSKGTIIISNKQIEKMFGYQREELLGQKIEKLIPERFRERHIMYREHFMKHLSIRQMGVGRDFFGLCKDGTEIPVEIGLAAANTVQEVFILASIIDISDRKKMEEFAHSNKDLEQFASIASHDLQAPLRHISSYVQFLVDKYKDIEDEETKTWVHFIQNGISHMRQLIQDLLSFSRVSKEEMFFEQVDCNQVLQEVLVLLDEKIKDSHATIKSSPLPSLMSSPIYLKQLFQNLIENGIKFHKKDTPPEIVISASQINDYWEFVIQDNGIGIDPQYHDKIFGIFQRLAIKQKVSGTGVGLAICKKIASLLGGKIWVESAEGKGSQFHFTLKNQAIENFHGKIPFGH